MRPRVLKVDLHLHSSHSPDSRVAPRDLVAEAKRRGLHAIAITDHGTTAGALEARKAAKGFQVLIGQEVRTRDGEVIVLGLEDDLMQGQDLAKTCREARDRGGLVIIPHPFDPLRQGVGKHLGNAVPYVDAIEVCNPRCFFERSNRKAAEAALAHGLPGVASSDAHRREDVGRAYTLVHGTDVLEAIRQGKVQAVAGQVGKRALLTRKLAKAPRPKGRR
ncbi:MAG: PHP domain-containing protein [Candidatus Aenigmarchaeota archaeon]|nr:PHP domain-containing protein [Candidatus Aenigmarchaeota archaeon]